MASGLVSPRTCPVAQFCNRLEESELTKMTARGPGCSRPPLAFLITTTVRPCCLLGEVKVRLGQSQGKAGQGRGQDKGDLWCRPGIQWWPPPLPPMGVLGYDS